MIAKMIIPTFILSGWRYLIIFDFFFFANALYLVSVAHGIMCPAKAHTVTVTQTAGENLPPRL